MKKDKFSSEEHVPDVLGIEMMICVGKIALTPPCPTTIGVFFLTDGEGVLSYNRMEFSMQQNMAALCSYYSNAYLKCEKLSRLLRIWLDAGDVGTDFSGFFMRGELSDDAIRQLRAIAEDFSAYKINGPDKKLNRDVLRQLLSRAEDCREKLAGSSRIARFTKDILDTRFPEDFTLDELAEELQVSKSKLIRDFKSQWNATPIEYLLARRLEESARLLIETTASIETIAGQVGFRGIPYFSIQFKKRYGLPPHAYRVENHFAHEARN